MSGKEDLRVKRTKKALTDAFMRLISQKPLEEITVNELCDEAEIRRATFYKHYTDKFDFLAAYMRSLRDRFDSVIWKADITAPAKEYYAAYAKHLVAFINENEAAINNVLKSNMFPTMLTLMLGQNYRDTRARLLASEEAGMKLPASVEVVSSAFAGAVAAAIYTWLVTGKKKSADLLAEEIGVVVDKLIES